MDDRNSFSDVRIFLSIYLSTNLTNFKDFAPGESVSGIIISRTFSKNCKSDKEKNFGFQSAVFVWQD